jgi:hypothetical protein
MRTLNNNFRRRGRSVLDLRTRHTQALLAFPSLPVSKVAATNLNIIKLSSGNVLLL